MKKSIQGIERRTCGRGTNGFIHYTPEANYYGAANDGNCFCERRAA